MADILSVNKNGTNSRNFSQEEIAQREAEALANEEKKKLDKLKPSKEELDKAEMQLLIIETLTELGVTSL